jgi:hypothetical protein
MTVTPAPLTCANHPDVETTLRCNQCGKPICPRCAVHTPTGYRCRECVRGQQKIFDTSSWVDYVVGFLVGVVVSAIASLLVMLVGSIAGFFAWFIIAIGASGVAVGIAEVLRFVTRRHRSPSLFITLLASILLGAVPVALYQLLSMNIWGIVFQVVYLVIAVPVVYYRLSGIRLFKRF